jgi:Holliday junction resolvase RusA-like endonuclease
MECIFIFERPKSHFGTGKNSNKLKSSAPAHHIQPPDCDNLKKIVADCLNGLVYKDDSQIVTAVISKKWAAPGELAKSIIKIKKID